MATFPETPVPIYPLTVTPVFNTLVSDLGNGNEQRRSKWLFPKYDVIVKYSDMSLANGWQTLFNFYQARKGAAEAFYIYDPAYILQEDTEYTDQYIATADGSTLTYDIPGRGVSDVNIYVNGVEETSGFSIDADGGESNSARVTFTSAVAQGALITCDFTGDLRIRARFTHDRLSRELFVALLVQTGIELTGLGPVI